MAMASQKFDVADGCRCRAIAEFVGKDLMKYSDEVIIENGGDIF